MTSPMNFEQLVSLYQRLALSRDKDEVLRLAFEGQVVEKAADLIKNHLTLSQQWSWSHFLAMLSVNEPLAHAKPCLGVVT